MHPVFVGSTGSFFVAQDLRRSPGGAVAVAASAHDCGPERSLRTSLGGPPLRHLRPGLRPSLQIPSGASRLLATTAPAPPGYEVLGLLRYKSCGQGMKSAGTPIAAARAAAIGIWHWGVEGVFAFANAVGGLLRVLAVGGGAVMGGARWRAACSCKFSRARRPSGAGVQVMIRGGSGVRHLVTRSDPCVAAPMARRVRLRRFG
ncbi:hypothetical protein D3C85_737960 [compost metagenome]